MTKPFPLRQAETGEVQEEQDERRQITSFRELPTERLQTRTELAALPLPDLSMPSNLRAQTGVRQGSGQPMLHRWAQNLVQESGLFEPFSQVMRCKADPIVVVSSSNFGRDDSLKAKLTNR